MCLMKRHQSPVKVDEVDLSFDDTQGVQSQREQMSRMALDN